MRNLRSVACIIALVACGAIGSACAKSNPGGPSTSTSTVPTINIVGQNGTQAFNPNPAGFGGQTVAFKNNDTITHRVLLNDGSVDTGDIAPGATSRTVQMPNDGTNYHCAIHPGMIGAVAASFGAPPPACSGQYCSPY